jgi:Zn-dependent protease
MISSGLTTQIIQIAIMVVAFIPAIVLHECAHGYAAYKLGDPTAKNAGRLTLNPVAHVDKFGTVILPACLIAMSVLGGGVGMMFGYAKPVPYNPRNFKDIRQGELIVGLAGPASNLLMSLIGVAVAWGGIYLYRYIGQVPEIGLYVWYFGVYFCKVNLFLAFFNLIPLPPLDGSSIIAVFLSDNALRTYYKIQRYSMFVLLLLILVIPYFTNVDIIGIYLNATAGNLSNFMLPI